MMSFLAALRFLTTIPTPWWRQSNRQEFSRSLAYYPLVGLLIGLLLAAIFYLTSGILPRLVEAMLLLLLSVLVSGGLHLDGLADTLDGLAASHKEGERWKQVMHEPGVGAFGVVALILDLGIKFALLSTIETRFMVPALIVMATTSRWTMLYSLFEYPYAREAGAGLELKRGTTPAAFAVGTVITLAVGAVVAGWVGVICVALVWLGNVILAGYARRKFGGLTGDVYGAGNELAEVLVLLAFVVASH